MILLQKSLARSAITSAVSLMALIPQTHAESKNQKISVQSAYDRFEILTNNGTDFSIENKPISLDLMKPVLNLLSRKADDICPPALPPKPDLTINSKLIFITSGTLREGDACVQIGGEGLLMLPYHREFLIGRKTGGIPWSSPIKVYASGSKIFELRQSSDLSWNAKDTQLWLEWDFLKRLQDSLTEYRIGQRLHPAVALGKPQIRLESAGITYEFSRISNNQWALKQPNEQFFVTSPDWAFWYDFSHDVYVDHLSDRLNKLKQSDLDLATRLSELEKLQNNWNPNLRDVLHTVITNKAEPLELRLQAMRRLRQKPAPPTALVAAEVLQSDSNDELRRLASEILRANDPKGPIYKMKASAREKQQTLSYWRQWQGRQTRGQQVPKVD